MQKDTKPKRSENGYESATVHGQTTAMKIAYKESDASGLDVKALRLRTTQKAGAEENLVYPVLARFCRLYFALCEQSLLREN